MTKNGCCYRSISLPAFNETMLHQEIKMENQVHNRVGFKLGDFL